MVGLAQCANASPAPPLWENKAVLYARRLVNCALMLGVLSSPRAVRAAGQAVQLAYKYHVGEPLTYSLHVEGNGKLSSSWAGVATLASSPFHSSLAAELVLAPIESLEDGASRVTLRVTKFSHEVSLPDFGTELRVYLHEDMLVFAKNGEESMLALPSAETGPSGGVTPEASPDLADLAALLSRPVCLRVSPNGEARLDSDAGSVAGLSSLGKAISLGAYQRFLNTPVKVKQIWSVEIPMLIPGVSASTITAHSTLESIDFVDNYRWARIAVRGMSVAESGNQPIFGCRERFRLEELSQELTGAFVFAVDQGRTIRQEMDMSFAMSALRLSLDRKPVGKIRVDMDVQSRLELVPSKGPPRGATVPPDLLTP